MFEALNAVGLNGLVGNETVLDDAKYFKDLHQAVLLQRRLSSSKQKKGAGAAAAAADHDAGPTEMQVRNKWKAFNDRVSRVPKGDTVSKDGLLRTQLSKIQTTRRGRLNGQLARQKAKAGKAASGGDTGAASAALGSPGATPAEAAVAASAAAASSSSAASLPVAAAAVAASTAPLAGSIDDDWGEQDIEDFL